LEPEGVQLTPSAEYEVVSPVTTQFDAATPIALILDMTFGVFDHVRPSEDVATSDPPPASHLEPFQATAVAVVRILLIVDHVIPLSEYASVFPPAATNRPPQATELAVVKIVVPSPVQLDPFAE
jgi:hypothetical protein